MKIISNSNLTTFLLLISLLLTGCSNNDNKESLHTILKDKENTLTAQEKIKELLIMTKGNYSQLACIFNTSPSTLKRLYQGETFATPEAEVEINKHYNYFLVKGNSIENFKADCISYAWYNHVKIFMSNWWFWLLAAIALYIFFVTLPNNDSEAAVTFMLMFLVLIFIGYIIIWIINYFGGTPNYESIQDNFVNTMDTVWESQI